MNFMMMRHKGGRKNIQGVGGRVRGQAGVGGAEGEEGEEGEGLEVGDDGVENRI